MQDRVAQCSERSVVHKGSLHSGVAEWGCSKRVSIRSLAGQLLAPEIFVGSRPVERVIRHRRRNLGNSEDVLAKVAEHLVGLSGDAVARHASGLAEEEECAALLLVGERVALAARE